MDREDFVGLEDALCAVGSLVLIDEAAGGQVGRLARGTGAPGFDTVRREGEMYPSLPVTICE